VGFGGLKISSRQCFFLLSNNIPCLQPSKANLSNASLLLSFSKSRAFTNDPSANVYLPEITAHCVSPLKMVLQLREESVAFSHPGYGVPEAVPDMSFAYAQEILLSLEDLYNEKKFPIVRQTGKK
jgi:hypothetical protein